MAQLLSMQKVFHAATFAASKHRDQRRKDEHETPYINHPLGVANNLIIHGNISDENIIMAALLHDTVEDTETTYEELVKEFGKEVADMVIECTDDKSLDKAERKRLQIVNASHKTPAAACVKMADKLYNLRDLEQNPPKGWPLERIQEYFVWAEKVTSQLYHHNDGLATQLKLVFGRNLKN